jgi:hypothetical protein
LSPFSLDFEAIRSKEDAEALGAESNLKALKTGGKED